MQREWGDWDCVEVNTRGTLAGENAWEKVFWSERGLNYGCGVCGWHLSGCTNRIDGWVRESDERSNG